MKKLCLLIAVLWKTTIPLLGQNLAFETLTVEDGLSQNSVTCITQDEKGFIWIGTRDGLNRYNGLDFQVFRKTPFDTTSLVSNNIHCLLPDGPTGLFVGTKNGLQRYDQLRARFENIHLDYPGSAATARVLYRDRTGLIWVGAEGGFYCVEHDPENRRYTATPFLFRTDPSQKDQPKITVTGFLQDRRDNFWIATTIGILRIPRRDNQRPQVDSMLLSEPEKRAVLPGRIQAITALQSGAIIASGESTLFQLDEAQGTFTVILDTAGSGHEPFGSQLGETPSGQLWVSLGSGILQITLSGHSIDSTRKIYPPSPGVAQNRYRVNYVWQDQIRKDLYWLATDLGGVIKMFSPKKPFRSLLLKDMANLTLSNPYVRHIVEDGNRIWINLGSGLLLADRNNGSYTLVDDLFPRGHVVSSGSISSLYKSRDGYLLAIIQGGLVQLRVGTHGRISGTHHPVSPAPVVNGMAVTEMPGYLILGYSTGQVSVLSKKDLKETRRFSLPGDGSISPPDITSLLLDNRATLWAGTNEGLFVYPHFTPGQESTYRPLHLRYDPADTTGLIENRITAIMQDSRNVIWICTRNGLMQAEEKEGQVTLRRIMAPALFNQVLYGILEDRAAAQLWLSSNSGLFRFDPKTGVVDNFDARDGLQGNEFNTFSYYQSASGEMFFGGTNGITSFFPSDIQLDTLAPLLWITNLTTSDNQSFNLLARNTRRPLGLEFSQRSFSVDFIGLDYLQSDNLKYYYTLSGSASLQRIPLGKSRQVNFSQLDPGEYVLEIFAVNSDGAESRNHDILAFTIRAPYWRMPWFYLLVASFVASLAWLLFYLRYQNQLKNLRAVEQVRKSISEDFHDELGSKLSIISMYSEFTKQELNKDNSKAAIYLDKVNDTASRLYENTRDLIWALNPQHDTLYDLFLQLKDFGEEMFRDTGIDFHSAGLSESWKKKNLPMRFKRHLLLIFKEGMHNALKHSGCKSVRLHIEEKDDKLIILLQDDGVGFDTTVTHKGDGLKNMARRAEHLQGKLHFISRAEGTRIWVELQQNLFS